MIVSNMQQLVSGQILITLYTLYTFLTYVMHGKSYKTVVHGLMVDGLMVHKLMVYGTHRRHPAL